MSETKLGSGGENTRILKNQLDFPELLIDDIFQLIP